MTSTSPAYASSVLLYVEDDPGAVNLFRSILADIAPGSQVFVFGAGRPAMSFLRREAPYADAPVPDLVVLDLNLPGDNGMEILKTIRRDTRLAKLRTLFFTTSDSPSDQRQANDLGALAFIRKPIDLDDFEQAMHHMLAHIPMPRA